MLPCRKQPIILGEKMKFGPPVRQHVDSRTLPYLVAPAIVLNLLGFTLLLGALILVP